MTKLVEMTPELEIALRALAGMKYPSVANLLDRRGFHFEADKVRAVVGAFEEATKEKTDGEGP